MFKTCVKFYLVVKKLPTKIFLVIWIMLSSCLTHVIDGLVGIVKVGTMAGPEKENLFTVFTVMLEMNLLTMRKQKRTMKVMERKMAP